MGRPQFNRKELITIIIDKSEDKLETLIKVSSMTDEELYKFSKL